MKRTNLPLALLVTLTVWVAGCGDGGGLDRFRADETELVSQQVRVAGSPTIIVDSKGGSVNVSSGGDGMVDVQAEKRASSRDDLRKMTVTVTSEGDTVRVSFTTENRSLANRSVKFTIKAPRDAQLQLATGGGSVNVTGFTRGADVRTGGGSVELRGTTGALRLRSGGGSIDVSGADGSVDIETGGGSVDVAGALRGTNIIRTGGGSITVTVPADSSLRVEGATGGGSAENDFGLPVRGQGSRSFGGTTGDGAGGSLDMRASGGSVRLRKAR